MPQPDFTFRGSGKSPQRLRASVIVPLDGMPEAAEKPEYTVADAG
jgi:hypothetical protein